MRRALAIAWFLTSPAWGCAVLQQLASIDARLGRLFEKLDAIEENAILGNGLRKWQDFDALDQAIAAAKLAKEVSGEALTQATALAPELRTAYLSARERLRDRNNPDQAGRKYAPTEYELLRAYQKKLAELNRYLPRDLRFPILRLAKETRVAGVREEARKLMKEQEARVEALYSTTGFESEAEYLKAVEGSGTEAKELLKAFQEETVRVAIRRPSRGRFWIDKVGFHNQFVTNSSNGAMSHSMRNDCEADYLGMQKADYSPLDPELKPNYVYFKPPQGSDWKENVDSQYGDDLYVLKLENLRDRLTFTPGDSLNRHNSRNGAAATSWDDLMVPWKHRALMIPFVLGDIKKSGAFKVGYHPPETAGTPLEPFQQKLGVRSQYTEGQVFGGMRLTDVKEFYFTKSAPDGDFLKSLIEHQIKIFDARNDLNRPTEWTPPTVTP